MRDPKGHQNEAAMRKLVLCSAMMLSGCISGPGTDPIAKAAATSTRDAYMECVFARAASSARLNEAAETLAIAAAGACGAEDAAAFTALRADANDDRLALVAMDRLRAKTKEGAVGVIIDRRTGRPPTGPAVRPGTKI